MKAVPIDFQFEAQYPLGSRRYDEALGRQVVRLCPTLTKGETVLAPVMLGCVLAYTYYVSRAMDAMPVFWFFTIFWGGMAAVVISTGIRRRMTGMTIVEIDDSPLVRGQKTEIRIYQEGDYPIEKLRVILGCSRHHIDKSDLRSEYSSTIYSHEVVAARGLRASTQRPIWSGELEIPADRGSPSRSWENGAITWGLGIEIEIPKMPDVEETFTLNVVAPEKAPVSADPSEADSVPQSEVEAASSRTEPDKSKEAASKPAPSKPRRRRHRDPQVGRPAHGDLARHHRRLTWTDVARYVASLVCAAGGCIFLALGPVGAYRLWEEGSRALAIQTMVLAVLAGGLLMFVAAFLYAWPAGKSPTKRRR